MAEEHPHVVSTAEIQLGSITMRVHHLSDNQRVIDVESFEAFMQALEDGTLLLTPEDAGRLIEGVSR